MADWNLSGLDPSWNGQTYSGDNEFNTNAWNGDQNLGYDANFLSTLGYNGPITQQSSGDNGEQQSPELSNWFKNQGYQLAFKQDPDPGKGMAAGGGYRAIADRTGNIINGSQYYMAPTDDRATWLAGTAAAALATGGIASAATGGGAIGAGTGAMIGAGQGALNTVGTNQSMLGGALRGAANGGLGGYMNEVNPAGYAGITDPNLQSAVNSGISGGISGAVSGGSPLESAAMSAIPGIANYGANKMGLTDEFSQYPSGGYSPAPWTTQGNALTDAQNYTPTPWNNSVNFNPGNASYLGNSPSAQTQQDQTVNPFMDKAKSFLSGLMGEPGAGGGFSFGGKSFGNLAEGLAGIYSAYKQRQMAQQLMGQINNNRNSYSQQMQSNLARQFAGQGRRADIGGQQVALQAALAQLDSRNAPAIANLQQQSMGGLMGMFQSGLRTGNKMGWFGQSPANTPAPNYSMPYLSTIGQQGMPTPNYSLEAPPLNNTGDPNDPRRYRLGGN